MNSSGSSNSVQFSKNNILVSQGRFPSHCSWDGSSTLRFLHCKELSRGFDGNILEEIGQGYSFKIREELFLLNFYSLMSQEVEIGFLRNFGANEGTSFESMKLNFSEYLIPFFR